MDSGRAGSGPSPRRTTSAHRLTIMDRRTDEVRHHDLTQPFAVIGRAERCDVRLEGSDVGYRHAFLQMIGGQLLCVDLGSRTGTRWQKHRKRADWLIPGREVHVGRYQITVKEEHTPFTADDFPLDFNPLELYSEQLGPLPNVTVDFLNGMANAPSWTLTRMVTLVGRAPGCKFLLDDEQISGVHCILMRSADGLWVVDLLSRQGTLVDERPVRAVRIPHGSTLQVGPYRMRVKYDQPEELDPALASIRHNRIFTVMRSNDTLLVTPQGDSARYHYADVQRESNKVRRLLELSMFKNLVVDLGMAELFGSVTIGVIVSLARTISESGGRAVLCNASPRTLEVLETMRLIDVWPHHATRDEALASLAK